MVTLITTAPIPCTYLLRFNSLYQTGRGVTIPCDADGQVDVDSLTPRLRTAYLDARTMIGREYAFPMIQQVH